MFFSTTSLLNLEVDLVFFDTTTTYFEVEEDDEDGLRYLGHSKDHRPDLPQVVIGLAVTKDGIPVRCLAWPGDTAGASVVGKVQGSLDGCRELVLGNEEKALEYLEKAVHLADDA